MDRCRLFVDAGYLLAAGAALVVGDARAKRTWCDVRIGPLAHDLMAMVEEQSGLPILRTYWYDGGWDKKPSSDHLKLLDVPLLKLRLGRLTNTGQKGVDSLLLRDLSTLARERAICTAFLVAGDEDIREGVTMAQELGVQVNLITVVPVATNHENTSRELLNEVDRIESLELEWLAQYITPKNAHPSINSLADLGGDIQPQDPAVTEPPKDSNPTVE